MLRRVHLSAKIVYFEVKSNGWETNCLQFFSRNRIFENMPKTIKSTIQISIPNPCREEWTEMKANGNGHFCNHCQHAIVDFSNLPDLEILRIMALPDAPKCGRWRKSQLNRVLGMPASPSNRMIPRLAVGAFLTFAMLPHALLAQSPPTQVEAVLEDGQKIRNNPEQKRKSGSEAVFSGKIIWSADGSPVEFVTIKVKDRPIGTISNVEGNFSLNIPQDVVGDQVEIQFYLQYNEILLEKTYSINQLPKHTTIELVEPEDRFSVGIIISRKDMRRHRRAYRREERKENNANRKL